MRYIIISTQYAKLSQIINLNCMTVAAEILETVNVTLRHNFVTRFERYIIFSHRKGMAGSRTPPVLRNTLWCPAPSCTWCRRASRPAWESSRSFPRRWGPVMFTLLYVDRNVTRIRLKTFYGNVTPTAYKLTSVVLHRFPPCSISALKQGGKNPMVPNRGSQILNKGGTPWGGETCAIPLMVVKGFVFCVSSHLFFKHFRMFLLNYIFHTHFKHCINVI